VLKVMVGVCAMGGVVGCSFAGLEFGDLWGGGCFT